MKRIITLLFVLLSLSTFATYISKDSCQKIAANFFYERYGRKVKVNSSESVKFTKYDTITGKKHSYLTSYVFNYQNGGWVWIRNQNTIRPIAGYCDTGTFTCDSVKLAAKGVPKNNGLWYKIKREGEISVGASYLKAVHTGEWNRLAAAPPKTVLSAVAPLVAGTKWNQSPSPFNDSCPYRVSDNCGHTDVGCVGTAMGIIMRFWKYPQHGIGSFTYTDYWGGYGTKTVNFGQATYDWNNMPLAPAYNSKYPEIAKFLYHCSESVGMQWGTDCTGGSGAYVTEAEVGVGQPCAQHSYYAKLDSDAKKRTR